MTTLPAPDQGSWSSPEADILANLQAEVGAIKEAVAAVKPVLDSLVARTEDLEVHVKGDVSTLSSKVRYDIDTFWEKLRHIL